MMMPPETLQTLCREDGDCLIWQHGRCNGHPAWRFDGKTLLVRRVLWEQSHGPIPPGKILRATCGNVLCLSPGHVVLTTYQRLAKQLGPAVMGGLVRSANVAKAKQGQPIAKLNWAMVREIRSSTESGAALARRMGLPQPLISRVRLHKGWKEYSSPFAGLGAR